MLPWMMQAKQKQLSGGKMSAETPKTPETRDLKPAQVQTGTFHSSAEIYTWGSEVDATNLGPNIKAKLQGTAIGHVSIALRFPVDKRGDKLIQDYCESAGIPYDVKEVTVTRTLFDKEGKAIDTPPETPDAYHAKYYEVYFSWWPHSGPLSSKVGDYSLGHSLEEDEIFERSGTDFKWDPRFVSEDLEIDHRKQRTLPPEIIVRPIPEKEAELLGKKAEKLREYARLRNLYRKLINEEYQLKRVDEKTEAQRDRFYKKIGPEIKQQKDKIEALERDLGAELMRKYIVRGLPPKHGITLPIAEPGQEGLALEDMLKEMKATVENKKAFGLYSRNCARTTRNIVAAGIKDKSARKTFLNDSSSLWMSTPQSLYKASRKLSSRMWLRLFPKQREFEDWDNVSIFRKALRKLAAYFKRKNVDIKPDTKPDVDH